jgi:hypothetical protein
LFPNLGILHCICCLRIDARLIRIVIISSKFLSDAMCYLYMPDELTNVVVHQRQSHVNKSCVTLKQRIWFIKGIQHACFSLDCDQRHKIIIASTSATWKILICTHKHPLEGKIVLESLLSSSK